MDDALWHYMMAGESVGPFSESQLRAMVGSGVLAPSVQIWKQGSEKWLPITEVFDLEDSMPPPLPSQPQLKPGRFTVGTLALTEWSTSPPHPWRRYFARMVDISINGILFFFCFGFILELLAPNAADDFFSIFAGPGGRVLDAIVTTFSAGFVTAVFIGLSGSSLGKWLFGVRVTDMQHRPIGYKTAFKREMMIWIRGLALGIPLIALFTLSSAYKKLLKDGRTSWDEQLNCLVTYRPDSTKQYVLGCVGLLLFLGAIAWLNLPS
jgi:uncharacterized RDD family membrane protein YckC